MLFWKGHPFLDPLFLCNIWLLGCFLSQRIWVRRYDTLDTRCMWRVHAYFLEYLRHKSQKYHNSIILNHMNNCTLARFQCIYYSFAFSIVKASKASKLLCRVFGPKCDYDGDIVISCFVFARMCVVQALPCIGLHLVVTTAWHLAALWRMCLQHAFYFVFHAFCFSVSCFNVSWFSWKNLVWMFLVFQCFLFLKKLCFDVSCFLLKNYVFQFQNCSVPGELFASIFCWSSPAAGFESCEDILPLILLWHNLWTLHYLFKQIGKVF